MQKTKIIIGNYFQNIYCDKCGKQVCVKCGNCFNPDCEMTGCFCEIVISDMERYFYYDYQKND